MKKTNFLTIFYILIFILCIFLIYKLQTTKTTTEEQTDSKKIYTEYTSLNDKSNEDTDIKYLTVSLNENNIYNYLDEEKLDNIFNNQETTVILLGSPTNNYTRSMISILEDASTSYGLNKIYYYNPTNDFATMYLENNEIVVDKESSSMYKKLTSYLSDYLEPYILTDENGKKYNTNELFIEYPTVVFIKDGVIKSVKTGTISNKLIDEDLTSEETTTLKEEYIKCLELIAETCDEKC